MDKKYLIIIPFLLLAIVLVIGYMQDYIYTNNSLKILKAQGNIIKIEMKISSSLGLKTIVITEAKKLDNINTAIREIQEINPSKGGSFKIAADVYVYKNEKKINFKVHFSEYNGWMIEIGYKTFRSDYIFHLIETYSANGYVSKKLIDKLCPPWAQASAQCHLVKG